MAQKVTEKNLLLTTIPRRPIGVLSSEKVPRAVAVTLQGRRCELLTHFIPFVRERECWESWRPSGHASCPLPCDPPVLCSGAPASRGRSSLPCRLGPPATPACSPLPHSLIPPRLKPQRFPRPWAPWTGILIPSLGSSREQWRNYAPVFLSLNF